MSIPKPKTKPNPLTLLDGGLGTTLTSNHGCQFDTSMPLWSSHLLLNPSTQSILQSCQTSFSTAGAEIIISATYQASTFGFQKTNITSPIEIGKLMRKAIEIARESANAGKDGREKGGNVALSLGAFGATMIPGQEYTGNYEPEVMKTVEGLKEWHLERLNNFIPLSSLFPQLSKEETEEKNECWKSIDFIAFETIPRIEEIYAARKIMYLLKEEEKKPVWITSVFPKEGNFLPDGSSVSQVVKAMLGREEGSDVPFGIGINCTKIGKIEKLIEEFEKAVGELVEKGEVGEWPALVVYPDGTKGEVYDTKKKEWVMSESGKEEGERRPWDELLWGIVERVRGRGVWKEILLGGCCKVGPEDIGRLRKRIGGFESGACI